MKEFFEPNLYLYDAYPGGIGFSEPLYRVHEILLRQDAGTDRRMPLRAGMPFVRGTGGREMREDQRSGAGDSGKVV